MNKSDSIGELSKALSKVQGQLKPAIKDAVNPFFKSNYADLNSVWDACRDLLTSNGLAVAQVNQPAEDGVIVETILMHESGEWLLGSIFLPLNKRDAQSVGSAITYGRRYGLASMVGIIADSDDDGNAASQPKEGKGDIATRIKKAEKAVKDLGGEMPNDSLEPEAYLAALTAIYKQLKENA